MSLADRIRFHWPLWHKNIESVLKLADVVDEFRFRLGANYEETREAFGRAIGSEIDPADYENLMREIERLEHTR
jgi:hypothetical protein